MDINVDFLVLFRLFFLFWPSYNDKSMKFVLSKNTSDVLKCLVGCQEPTPALFRVLLQDVCFVSLCVIIVLSFFFLNLFCFLDDVTRPQGG